MNLRTPWLSFGGTIFLIWYLFYYYICKFWECLRPCGLVLLKAFFLFLQVVISDTSGEITGVYKSCDKLNPEYLRSVSLGILPEKL